MGEEEKIRFDSPVVSSLVRNPVELESFVKGDTGQGMLGVI